MKSLEVSLQLQLACAKRELALRERVYPKWVADGKMPQAKADHEIAAMTAIVETLQKLQDLQVSIDEDPSWYSRT